MTQHYTITAKILHWLTAAAVFCMLAIGWYMTSLELSPLMLKLYSWHKWIGVCILLITVLRLIWRLGHPAPALPQMTPRSLRYAAHGGHIMLYALLIAMPLVGWIRSSAAGFPVVWFSVVPLPDPIGPNKQVSELFSLLHWAGGWLLVALLVGHIGTALWHHLIKRDDVLIRMLPGGKHLAVAMIVAVVIAATPWAEAGSADVWQIDGDSSEITFTARQMNVPFRGKFGSFSAAIVFDLASPENASIKLEIDATTIATGISQADQALKGTEWFAVADHPVAIFEASGFKPAGGDSYEIAGILTVKGHSETVIVNASITSSPDPENPQLLFATAKGQAMLSRTAFKVGEGQWASTATIADEVIVAFALIARREK